MLETHAIRRTGLILAMAALALAPLTAPVLALSQPLAALLIRDFFSHICHQEPSRSFLLAGSPVAVCVRCLGIYAGVALTPLLPIRKALAHRLLAVTLVLNVLDAATEVLHWHGNLPIPRFLLGLSLGCAAGLILLHKRPQSV